MYIQSRSLVHIFLICSSYLMSSCTLHANIENLNSLSQSQQPKPQSPLARVIVFSPSITTTSTFQVDLSINAENAVEMLVTNQADCSISGEHKWEPYNTTKTDWPIFNVGGVNYIYIKVRNESHLESECVKTSVNHTVQVNPISLIQTDEADPSLIATPLINYTYSSLGNTFSLADIEYGLGDSLNSVSIKPWTSLGISGNPFQATGLSLVLGTIYYIHMRAKDSEGNYSAVTSKAWKVVNTVSVAARYPAAPNWNDYVKKSAPTTACALTDANYYACLHGGEKKEFSITGENLCGDITAYDTLDVFDWTCQPGNPVKIISRQVRVGKGLKDLVNSSSWKNNKIIVKKSGIPIAASAPSPWWTNPVTPLPDNSTTSQINLTTESTVYTLSTTRSTKGYNIVADKIAIVTINNSQLLADPAETPNSTSTANPGTDIYSMFITRKKHIWLEGHFVGTFPTTNAGHYFLIDNATGLNMINNSIIEGFYYAIYNGFQKSAIKSLRSFRNRFFHYSGTSSNITVRDSSFQELMNSFSFPNTVSNNVFAHNYFSGIGFSPSKFDLSFSTNTTMAFNTISSTFNLGGSGTTGVNVHSTLIPNSTEWLYMTMAANSTISHYISNYLNFIGISGNNIKFSGLVSYNSLCSASNSAGVNVGITSSCLLTTPSTGTILSGIDILHNSTPGKTFVGFIPSDSHHPQYTTAGMKFENITNWSLFDKPSRIWVNSSRSLCMATETCFIYDYSLDITDSVILNRSGGLTTSNSIFPTDPASNCPAEVHGNQVITDLRTVPQNYLKNAFEIIGDESGDDDGLCESNEECVYAPNIGAYQGHGNYYTKQCQFQNGTITGVTMYAYPQNGY